MKKRFSTTLLKRTKEQLCGNIIFGRKREIKASFVEPFKKINGNKEENPLSDFFSGIKGLKELNKIEYSYKIKAIMNNRTEVLQSQNFYPQQDLNRRFF